MSAVSNLKNNLFLQIVMLFIHTKQYEHMQLQFLKLRHIKNVLYVKGFAVAVIVTLTFIPSSHPQIVLEDLHDKVSFYTGCFPSFPGQSLFITVRKLLLPYTSLYVDAARTCKCVFFK